VEIPEIHRVDLASALLEIYAWGDSPEGFPWFEMPSAGMVAQATGLLTLLGAVRNGKITALGGQMASLPLHPRLARVILEGADRGCLREVATAAALVEERDPWPNATADLMERIAWVDGNAGGDRRALAAVRRVRDQLMRLASGSSGGSEESVIRALLAGFPDRVARKREGDRGYQLASGQGAALNRSIDPLPWLLAIDLAVGRQGLAIRRAEPIEPEWLDIVARDGSRFDAKQQRVVSERVTMFGAIVLSSKPAVADPVEVAGALAEAAARSPRKALSFDKDVDRFLTRLRWLSAAKTDLGLPTFEDWADFLAHITVGQSSFAGLRKLDLLAEIRGFLTFEQRRSMDRLTPKTLRIPSGSNARITYGEPGSSPVLAARIQQLFGMRVSPEIAGVRVTVHLLAPNNRPQQITSDLENFWATTYAEVRKDLRGRYPKHHWPEDPLSAKATDRAKRRGD
jgi:ATP-dependent helicase HrpB